MATLTWTNTRTTTSYRPSLILSTYMALWIIFYFLTHHSSPSVGSTIRPAVLVLAVESIKLVFTICLRRATLKPVGTEEESLSHGSSKHNISNSIVRELIQAYFPIACIYCAYNNLVIVNLQYFDPTTFLVLSSSRLLLTACLWQFIFGKKITLGKWTALILITMGVMIKDFSPPSSDSHNQDDKQDMNESSSSYFGHVACLVAQLLCSVAGSVYNERVLKTISKEDPHLHNLCLYAISIVLNAFLAFYSTPSLSQLGREICLALTTARSLGIVIVLSCVGITASMLLRYIDSVAKVVAGAAEPAIAALLGLFVLGEAISSHTAVSILFISIGTYLYSVPLEIFHIRAWIQRMTISRTGHRTIVYIAYTSAFACWLSGCNMAQLVSPSFRMQKLQLVEYSRTICGAHR